MPANAASALVPFVVEILDDGEWHYQNEIALKMLKHIAPERAIRAYGKQDQGLPLAYVLQHGASRIIHNTLAHLRDAGRVEARGEARDPQKRWRLIDEAALAWARVAREKGGDT